MEIRKIQMEDANNYLDMLLNLDNETKFMMFEPGERPTDINIIKNIIEKIINGDNLILVAKDEENIVGFLSAQKGEYKRIKHTGYIVVGIREKYRGKGIGSKLFSELDTWAIEKDMEQKHYPLQFAFWQMKICSLPYKSTMSKVISRQNIFMKKMDLK